MMSVFSSWITKKTLNPIQVGAQSTRTRLHRHATSPCPVLECFRFLRLVAFLGRTVGMELGLNNRDIWD